MIRALFISAVVLTSLAGNLLAVGLVAADHVAGMTYVGGAETENGEPLAGAITVTVSPDGSTADVYFDAVEIRGCPNVPGIPELGLPPETVFPTTWANGSPIAFDPDLGLHTTSGATTDGGTLITRPLLFFEIVFDVDDVGPYAVGYVASPDCNDPTYFAVVPQGQSHRPCPATLTATIA